MRNPAKMILHAWRVWSSLRKKYPDVFTASDAWRQFYRVWLPARFPYRAAGKALARMAEIDELAADRYRVRIPEQGISFYWPQRPDPNMYFTLEQEFDFRNPHYYTTRPIGLGRESRIFDVGACEGLFALRTAKAGDAAKVFCFEPDAHMSQLIEMAALENDVSNIIQVVNEAVAKESGEVSFVTDEGPEGGRLAADGGTKIPATSIDDFCERRKLKLTKDDLIKIDAGSLLEAFGDQLSLVLLKLSKGVELFLKIQQRGMREDGTDFLSTTSKVPFSRRAVSSVSMACSQFAALF